MGVTTVSEEMVALKQSITDVKIGMTGTVDMGVRTTTIKGGTTEAVTMGDGGSPGPS